MSFNQRLKLGKNRAMQMAKSSKAKVVAVGGAIAMGSSSAMAAGLTAEQVTTLSTSITDSTTSAVALGVLTLTAVITFWGLKAAKRAL